MASQIGRRELLQALLAEGRFEEVARAAILDSSLIPDVFRLLYHADPVIQHRAAACLAEAVRHHPERARPLLERLAWAMNDESGNYCPGAPVAMAELANARPEEAKGFVPPLLGAVEEEPPDPNFLWAAGILVASFPEEVGAHTSRFLGLLSHDAPLVRALAARVLIRLRVPFPPDRLKALLSDSTEVTDVECLHPVTRTVRDVVLHETIAPCCGGGSCSKPF